MLDLVSDWEPLPSVASIQAASSFHEPRNRKAKGTVSTALHIATGTRASETLPPALLSELKTEPADPTPSPQLVPSWLEPLLVAKQGVLKSHTQQSTAAPDLQAEPEAELYTKGFATASQEHLLQSQVANTGVPPQQQEQAPLLDQQSSAHVKPQSASSQEHDTQLLSDRDRRHASLDQAFPDQQAGSHIKAEQRDHASSEERPDISNSSTQHPDTCTKSEPAESSQEDGELSEEEGQISGDHDSSEVPAATPAKRKRGERAGKRVRQRIAKRAREREERQLGLEANPHQQQPHNPAKPPKRERPTCKYFLFGKCSKGDSCPFPHAGMPVTKLISCRFFNQGTCQKGDACPYSHDNTLEPCKQLVLHGVCRFGPHCHFSHAPLAAYAVAPLQDWFKEQDQLKLDRSARLAQEAEGSPSMHSLDDAEEVPESTSPPEPQESGALGQFSEGQHPVAGLAPMEAGPSTGVTRYSSWKEPWEQICAPMIQAKQQAKQQQALAEDVDYEPLSGPYSTWHDGWNKLFAQDRVKLE